MTLEKEFMAMLSKHPKGCPDKAVQQHFGADTYKKLVVVVQQMLNHRRLKLFQKGGDLIYQLVSEEEGEKDRKKFRGCTDVDIMVYQVIQKAANQGIWTRDLKYKTGLQQQQMTKILKGLERRRLIKSVKIVAAKNRKMYMLYELEPARELTGGAWYADGEFDVVMVQQISKAVMVIMEARGGMITLADITKVVNDAKLLNDVVLTAEDMAQLMNILVFDDKIELIDVTDPMIYLVEVHNEKKKQEEENAEQVPTGTNVYRLKPQGNHFNTFTSVPCGVCEVAHKCVPGGVVSPTTCVYLPSWLHMEW